MLPINKRTKKLHCGINNCPKCLQNLSGTTTCKNIFQHLFLLLLLVRQSLKRYICVVLKIINKLGALDVEEFLDLPLLDTLHSQKNNKWEGLKDVFKVRLPNVWKKSSNVSLPRK